MKIQSTLNKIKIAVTITVAVALFSAWSWTLSAADTNKWAWSTSSYTSYSIGAAFLQNITVEHGGGVLQWKPGPRFDIVNGSSITTNWAAELQYGFAYNGMSKVSGQPVSNGDLWSVPIMFNGIYKYKFKDENRWQLYGGLGGGPLISIIGTAGPASQGYTDCTFGYQAMLGVKYHFNNLECGLGYNFLGSLDHHFATTTSPTFMHSLMLTLTF